MGKKKKKQKKSTGKSAFSVDKNFKRAFRFHNDGELQNAEKIYKNIIQVDPQHADAHHLYGIIALERGENDRAEDLIKAAIRIIPDYHVYHNNLGTVYKNKKLFPEAKNEYEEAVRIKPDYTEAYNNLGTLLKETGELTEALACYNKAISFNKNFIDGIYNLGTVLCEQGRISESIQAYRDVIKLNSGMLRAYSNLLYTLHYSDSVFPEDLFKEHQQWARVFADPLMSQIKPHENIKDPTKKIRIGYVSPDFCVHSVSFFIEDLFSLHDRDKFEIFCYSNTLKIDSVTERLKAVVDNWLDITSISFEKTAAIVRADKIDILVDLAGHTRNNCITLFALKPAPVQVSWLGYPDTTGLKVMDYRFTDNYADPVGMTEHLNSENLYRLPGSFLCYKPPGDSLKVEESPITIKDRITFGSFNNGSKISPTTVKLWAGILKRVTDSRLILKSRSLTDIGTQNYLLGLFENEGISVNRIEFEGYTASLKDHFFLYHSIDIALDTFPYHGTTTTCEALWMGVPVVTLKGSSHVSRVGISILSNIGQKDLIAESFDDYVNKAVSLAQDTELLKLKRSKLRGMMKDSPLMNQDMFTANIEVAFQDMWTTWCQTEFNPDKADESLVMEKNSHNMDDLTNNYFEKNIHLIKENHSAVMKVLNSSAPFQMDVRRGGDGIPNLFIKKEANDFIPLYNENGPLNDLDGLLKMIEGIRGKVVCIMGAGLCIHAEHILKKIGDYNLIVLFEAFPAIFNEALHSVNLSTVLAHPNLRLAIGDSVDPYNLFTKSQDQLYASNGGQFIENRNSLNLATDWYVKKRKQFEQFFTKKISARHTVSAAGHQFLSNSISNLAELADSRPLNTLKDIFKDKPAVVVASGPSLSKNIHKIKKIQDLAIIIAADSAVVPLLNNGIKPHFIVSVDFNDFTYEKLSPIIDDIKDTSLIFIPTVTPKILKYINFSSKYYSFPDDHIQSLFNRLLSEDSDCLEDAQSVIHLAITSAQIFGCNPIVFSGLDLAFSSNKDHANGTILHWGNNRVGRDDDSMVESIHGDMIPSNPGFVGMIEICERIISVVPDRKYIDATEGGAKIKGTDIMTLSDVIIDLSEDKIVFPELSNQVENVEKTEQVLGNLKLLMVDVKKCEDSLTHYFTENSKVQKYIKTQNHLKGLPESFPDKIKHSIYQMDNININLESDKTIYYLQMLLSKSYDEYLSYEMTQKGAESISDLGATFLNGLKQQVFVQKIRKNALTNLANLVDEQISIFEGLNQLEGEDKSDSVVFQMKLGEYYYQHGFINKAEKIFVEIESNAESDFFLGCINIKKGKIEKGLSYFERALSKQALLKQKIDDFILKATDALLQEDNSSVIKKLNTDRALAILDSCFKKNRTNIEFLKLYTLQLFTAGRADDGIEVFNELISLAPSEVSLLKEVGDNYTVTMDYESALTVYEECLALMPENVGALFSIGEVYYLTTKMDAAALAYETVLLTIPDHEPSIARLKEIKNIDHGIK